MKRFARGKWCISQERSALKSLKILQRWLWALKWLLPPLTGENLKLTRTKLFKPCNVKCSITQKRTRGPRLWKLFYTQYMLYIDIIIAKPGASCPFLCKMEKTDFLGLKILIFLVKFSHKMSIYTTKNIFFLKFFFY